jgi:hypothetical protein
MCTITLNLLTISEAEDLIAGLWRDLEEHGAPSPRLRVSQFDEKVELSVEFLSEQDAEAAKRVLPHVSATAA